MSTKSFALIGIGALNLIHAGFHILQVVQSAFLMTAALDHENQWIEKVLHSPYLAILWGVIGLLTMFIGIWDFKHHRDCADKCRNPKCDCDHEVLSTPQTCPTSVCPFHGGTGVNINPNTMRGYCPACDLHFTVKQTIETPDQLNI